MSNIKRTTTGMGNIIYSYRYGAGGGVNLKTNLLHWWDLGDANDAIDSHGSLNLTETSAVSVASGAAPDGGDASDFGATDHFTGSFTIPSAMTIGCWIYHNAGGDGCMMYKDTAASKFGGLITYASGIRAQNNSLTAVSGGGSQGVWNCLMMTMDGSGEELFLNNVSQGTHTRGLVSGAGTLVIGGNQNGGSELDGRMVSAAVWNVKLGSAARAAFYNSGVNLRYSGL